MNGRDVAYDHQRPDGSALVWPGLVVFCRAYREVAMLVTQPGRCRCGRMATWHWRYLGA